jgi:hypothetical protein
MAMILNTQRHASLRVIRFECQRRDESATSEKRALRQYVSFLAGQAEVRGVDLNAAPTPLVQ